MSIYQATPDDRRWNQRARRKREDAYLEGLSLAEAQRRQSLADYLEELRAIHRGTLATRRWTP